MEAYATITFIMTLILLLVLYEIYQKTNKKTNQKTNQISYNEENKIFPFRYFSDGSNNPLPFVAVTGFFRDKEAKKRYYEYKEKGLHLFGITAYKTFPNKKRLDESEGEFEKKDDFDYTGNIKNWLCCFKNKEHYGFTNFNRILDMSESDFYDIEVESNVPKKYDFIYICGKDGDECPLNGWNAINRNFDLALKCFPILMNEFKLKGLVVGREGCGLETLYGDRIEVVGFLEWHIMQEKMRESRILFVPNIYDASPRVVAECITKNIPVLMNKEILCGFKYIHYETGEFFSNEKNFKPALQRLLGRMDTISPKEWWKKHYSTHTSYKKLRDFLAESFPGTLDDVKEVKFIL